MRLKLEKINSGWGRMKNQRYGDISFLWKEISREEDEYYMGAAGKIHYYRNYI